MTVLSNTLAQDIRSARDKIALLFVDQCANGQQSKTLHDSTSAACGQFIGPQAHPIGQRGLHGTAAALRVLADSNVTGASDVVPRLVKYLETYPTLAASECSVEHSANKLDCDVANVIKISEQLYALSFVQTSQGNIHSLVKCLADTLLAAIIQNKGWAYFADQKDSPELLPTAYAIRALSVHGYVKQIEAQCAYLHKALKDDALRMSGALADVSTRIACLFVLSFPRRPGENGPLFDDIKALIKPIWKSMEGALIQVIEQNVEYTRDNRTFYVRVPWQLYLLALAARHGFFRWFSSYRSQTLLCHVLEDIERDALRYPHSGRYLSSRTNAIAYDVLSFIVRELGPRRYSVPAYVFDRLRVSLGSAAARWSASAIALVIIIYAVCNAIHEGKQISDTAPDLIAGLLVWTVSLARR